MNQRLKIKDLNPEDRPRERLEEIGAKYLSDYELLAIVLGGGSTGNSSLSISQQLLKEFGSFKKIMELEKEQLVSFSGIGPARYSILQATFEICQRVHNPVATRTLMITKPGDVYKLIHKELFNKKREHLFLISLDARNKMISKDLISIGDSTSTLITPREVFKKALYRGAISIILVHNHPSNDSTPSTEDIVVTEKISELGEKLDIPLVDHIIFSDQEYTSLKSLGLTRAEGINDKFSKKGGENE